MIELDDLIGACEDHLMLSHNGAAAHGRNADLGLFPFFPVLAAVVSIAVRIVQRMIDAVCQRKGNLYLPFASPPLL